jgi:hypothetical protein
MRSDSWRDVNYSTAIFAGEQRVQRFGRARRGQNAVVVLVEADHVARASRTFGNGSASVRAGLCALPGAAL